MGDFYDRSLESRSLLYRKTKGGAYFTMKYTAARGIETINIFTIERQDNQMEISKNTAQGVSGKVS